jgi:multiple sugar transport system ATP-binding protein
MSQVKLENVSKVYESGNIAVRNANLNVESREFIVIVGPSGCGKSTLLRMIAGLEDITSGTVTIGDKVVNDVPPKDRDIAMVFQNYALYPHMSVFDNMAFGLKLRGYGKDEIKRRVYEAAKILNITQYLESKPKDLSGGERQRVAVGRAIVRKPLVFLFDEPLSNLDAKMRVMMRTELHKLHTKLQATMIYVTHDQVEAMTMSDRIVVMNQSLIQQVADPLTIYNQPANKFVASFIGSPPMNFLEGELVQRNKGTYFKKGPFYLRLLDETAKKAAGYVGKRVTFGIRPEDLYDKLFATVTPSENVVTAMVDVVEPLGAEVYLHLRVGDDLLVARVGPQNHPNESQEIDLVFDMSKAHFFDPETEVAIV